MITFELKMIGPDEASEMLLRNVGNRKLNDKQVKLLASDMSAGQWRLTHQAIALGVDGQLIDGQHRLQAVVKSGVTIHNYVARYGISDNALSLPIDLHRKRSHVDILQCNQRHVEVVNTLYWIFKQRAATVSETQTAIVTFEPHIQDLHEAVTVRPRVRGSAGVRAAVLLRMMTDAVNANVYVSLYRDFCLLNFSELNSTLLAFIKQCEGSIDHNVGQNGRNVLFAKTWYAFDLQQQDRKIIRLSKDQEAEILNEVRHKMMELFVK